MVEQLTLNQRVLGSSPSASTTSLDFPTAGLNQRAAHAMAYIGCGAADRVGDVPLMRMRQSIAAITNSARSVELTRRMREETEKAILISLELLRKPVYPGCRVPSAEQ